MENDLNFGEPIKEICKKCGKRKGEHQAKTLFCPDTRMMKVIGLGWTAFISNQKFEMKPLFLCALCGKQRIFHKRGVGTYYCPLGSYNYLIKGYEYFHPVNKFTFKKKKPKNNG